MEKRFISRKGTVVHDGPKRSFRVILDPSSARSVLSLPLGFAFTEDPSTQPNHSGAHQINLDPSGLVPLWPAGCRSLVPYRPSSAEARCPTCLQGWSVRDKAVGKGRDNVPPPGMVGNGQGSDTQLATVEPAPMDLD
uniref:Uncharacterized protein n=1 Tax=Trichuris muris TaxID=70415 RepID=A0A5S6Q5L7_TRIMR